MKEERKKQIQKRDKRKKYSEKCKGNLRNRNKKERKKRNKQGKREKDEQVKRNRIKNRIGIIYH